MMTCAQFEQAMQAQLQRKPFQPFVIEFDEGEPFMVGHPKALMYRGGYSGVFFGPDGSISLFHSEAVRGITELVPARST
jgi:hypothetical protein